MMEYAYFPGCAAEATTKEADRSTRVVARHLGISLRCLPEFSCCGAGCLSEEFPQFNLALNARNLALAEEQGRDILTLCNTCLLQLRKSQQELENQILRQEINEELKKWGLEYKGKVRVLHLLHLLEEIGAKTIESMVKNPLGGIRIAPFYGCHILRPRYLWGEVGVAETQALEKLIHATGATAIDFPQRLSCCGFHLLLVDEKASLRMTAECLQRARESGADLLVTPCTLCHISLDMYQAKAGRLVGSSYNLPILHLSQLLGLALGVDPRRLYLQNHLVKVTLRPGCPPGGSRLNWTGQDSVRADGKPVNTMKTGRQQDETKR